MGEQLIKPLTLSLQEASDFLGVSTEALLNAANNGEVAYIKSGSGQIRPRKRFLEADLIRYLESKRVECQYTNQKEKMAPSPARTTGTTSGTIITGFTELRERRKEDARK